VLKVAVIGGGSTYTPELLAGFLERQDVFPIDELWLMDIDEDRLAVVGGFAQRMAKTAQANFKVVLSNDQRAAIDGSAYVITQLRVGKMAARREDEYLGKKYGIVGQETTGIGGMAKALRTIPVILNIAEDIRDLSPEALLVNFSNPSGLVTEALSRYAPDIKSVGVCNAAITTKMEILEQLEEIIGKKINPRDAQIKALGLNHLTWYYGFEVNGVDYWPQIMKALIGMMQAEDDPYFDPHTLTSLNMLPNSYLRYYYYTQKMVEKQNLWPPSRAEEIFEIEKTLIEKYSDPTQESMPEELLERGGAFYSTVAVQLLNAHLNDLNEIQILNVRHNGAVAGWDPDWVLELPCRISVNGIMPLPAERLPAVCEALLRQVKAFELLTVDAAVNGDRNAAFQALLAHPLGPPADQIQTVLEDMLTTNRAYLPKFFK
jgi:6-phospho-beta-glucosidase